MKYPRNNHPDNHNGLYDWHLYGPRDGEISDLVSLLAYEHGMRLADIEILIKQALKNKISELEKINQSI